MQEVAKKRRVEGNKVLSTEKGESGMKSQGDSGEGWGGGAEDGGTR